jgi:hypothetical protein
MILVRDIFQVKLGQMDKVLAGLKGAMESSTRTSMVSRVLTDISGRYFTLVVETKAESMDAYWENLQAGFKDPEVAARDNPLLPYVESGHREFYNIEYEAEN